MYKILILLLGFTSLAFAQKKAFPDTWEGKWSGNLEIYTSEGLKQTVPMELHILPTDSTGTWAWTTYYGADKKDTRNYFLKTVDASKKHYQTDEGNGIVLDEYFIGDVLWSWFEVGGQMLLASYRLEDKKLIFEIPFASNNPIATTGGQDEENPTVKSFRVSGVQRATLKRKK